ncbi:L-piperidine-6-carboxylate dehydrogenase [Maribellus maritimus]|uniref:L-piperidine-6-carboxylate dehydrogenase n=1 Tax=Maribellus maritimus TaxID=2870838 RepID=UPI001EECD9D6|nr:aldehyde dehydrogenase family protein [Maribellus maritimus]MCG6185798.1 aldehyde dehydrogenase family protein [Maribellus maritimus]
MKFQFDINADLQKLGVEKESYGICTGTKWKKTTGNFVKSFSPSDGKLIGGVYQASPKDFYEVIQTAKNAFGTWRMIPAPKRGEIVRQIGLELRKYKEPLGRLVSYEMGKILQEGLGEVQEMIDICDFAVGQSRQLYGFTMHSEREKHRMYDQYHPLGVVGVISAFNFPVAVWAWNAMIALVCGDVVVWKPSSKVYLCAVAVHKIIANVLKENNVPEGVVNLVAADSNQFGDEFLSNRNIPLISFTGSTKVGKKVGRLVGGRLGKAILELGGNNAIIVTKNAHPEMALRAVVFGAVGTCGQRCTSTRRIIVHQSIFEMFKEKLVEVYKQLAIGHALDPQKLVGPLVDKKAVQNYLNAIQRVEEEGGKMILKGEVLTGDEFESGCFVSPSIAEVENHFSIVQEETFAPLLYMIKYTELDEAIRLHNAVPQGLSSAMFSTNLLETEKFLSHEGSDCGIANVNIGTSGAEIGGAFGGEKETGGGRESGSDAWKSYMWRQTNTINFSTNLPLAQGIKFDV